MKLNGTYAYVSENLNKWKKTRGLQRFHLPTEDTIKKKKHTRRYVPILYFQNVFLHYTSWFEVDKVLISVFGFGPFNLDVYN